MSYFTRSLQAKMLTVLALISLVLLAACGSGPSSSGSSGSGGSSKTLIVASKDDPEAQIIGEMYVLLLTKAGYKVTPKLSLGQTPVLDAAIKSGAIDIYPEFTATALNIIKQQSSYDPQKDYDTVKAAYESQFKITWLDYSPLNDGYALCMSQAQSNKLGIKTLSALAPKVKDLTLATQSDGVPFIDTLKTQYGFTTTSFKSVKKVDYAIGFSALKSGDASVAECYTTDGSVITGGNIFLTDDKHGFPEFHPAPIVRDSVLQANPDIAATLNKVAPKLTTEISIQLQGQVSTAKAGGTSIAQAVKQVATKFLQDQGLL